MTDARLTILSRMDILGISLFTLLAHILVLALPLFTIQLFDQVLNSGSLDSLMVLAVPTSMALLTYCGLDWARSQLILNASHRLEEREIPEQFGAGQIQSKLVNFLRSQAPGSLLDAAFTPIYILLPFFFHPLAGLVGIATTTLLSAFVLLEVALPSLSPQAYWQRLIWVRSLRLLCQFSVIVTGGYLLLSQSISIGGMIALMLIIPKALAGIQGVFTVLPASRDAKRALDYLHRTQSLSRQQAQTANSNTKTQEAAHA